MKSNQKYWKEELKKGTASYKPVSAKKSILSRPKKNPKPKETILLNEESLQNIPTEKSQISSINLVNKRKVVFNELYENKAKEMFEENHGDKDSLDEVIED